MNLRPARAEDAAAVARLCGELGYAPSVADCGKRLAMIGANEDHRIFVGESEDGEVIGWVHVFRALRAESEPFAELGGLVVAEERRGEGLGRLLVEAARTWARDRGLAALRVRSNVTRVGARRFYERLGFRRAKTQSILTRRLD